MTLSNGEKHQYLNFTSDSLSPADLDQFAEMIPGVSGDLIINLERIQAADKSQVQRFSDILSPLLDENIVILVGDEDRLEDMGFLEEEFPVTPTYNEAMDFLFMLQLEKDLDADE